MDKDKELKKFTRELQAQIEQEYCEEVITACTFQTEGCGAAIACDSAATELAENRSILQALTGVRAEEIPRRSSVPKEGPMEKNLSKILISPFCTDRSRS